MRQRLRALLPRVSRAPGEIWGLRLLAVVLSILLWAMAPRTPVAEQFAPTIARPEFPALSGVDAEQSMSFPVHVAALNLPRGARLETARPEPSRVVVRGASKALKRVTQVVAVVQMTGEDGGQTVEVPVHALDGEGRVVTDVVFTPDQVGVIIVIIEADETTAGFETE